MNETLQLFKRHLKEMWHRRWIGLAAAWAAALIGIAVVHRIPERYEASARVYVDTESVLRPLLAGLAVQPNIDQQVALVSRTLISRPNVEKLVRMADLDLAAKTNEQRDAVVDGVLRSVRLSSGAQSNLYVLSYQNPDPEKARRVVQSMLTIFVESSLGDKRQDSRSAVKFLDDQIKQYEGTLQAAENRMKEFRLRYLGFSEREGDYFQRMGEVQKQIALARMELQAAQEARDAYQKELKGEEPVFLPDPSANAVVDSVPELDGRLASLRKELDELTRKYTDNHPDVQASRRLIAQLEEQRKGELAERRKLAEASAGKGARSVDRNPVFQQLRVSSAEAEALLASARAKLAAYEGQYAQLRSRASMVPQVEAEFAQLNRDYEVQKKTYESLLARREAATMGIDMQDSGGAQFRVIDPPRVSPQPVAPNRLMLLGLAFVASVATGLLVSFIAAQVAPTFHDAGGLREATSRPVLGLVSTLPSSSVRTQRRRGGWLFAGGVSGLVAMFAAVAGFAMVLWRAAS